MEGPSRQLPFEEFQRVLVRERQRLSKDHAKYSGLALAETLVGRGKRLGDLNQAQRAKMLKRYHVPPSLAKTFFNHCKKAIRFEVGFQLYNANAGVVN